VEHLQDVRGHEEDGVTDASPPSRRPRPNEQRNETIVARRWQGDTLGAIGKDYGITRERVRQLCNAHGGPGPEALQRIRDLAEQQQLDHEAELVRTYLFERPAATLTDIIAGTGLTRQTVRDILGHEASIRDVGQQGHTRGSGLSDDAALGAIRRVADAYGEPLSGPVYDEHRAEFHGLSQVRLIQRFTSWSNACGLAGVRHVNPVRDKYEVTFTTNELWRVVIEYLSSPNATGAFSDFDSWLHRRKGYPSSATVRNVLGAWIDVKTEALPILYGGGSKACS
jgi:hypothetical protein